MLAGLSEHSWVKRMPVFCGYQLILKYSFQIKFSHLSLLLHHAVLSIELLPHPQSTLFNEWTIHLFVIILECIAQNLQYNTIKVKYRNSDKKL
jgi:hypothetical protein